MSKNISSGPSSATADNKNTSTEAQRGKKRAAPLTPEGEAKKRLTDHHSVKAINQPKFVSATEMAANARTNVQMMPEISDEELLEMAIKFEKDHPQ